MTAKYEKHAHTRVGGALAGAGMALAVVAGIQATAGNPDVDPPGPFDMTAKIHVSEIVSGASAGMRDRGWSNDAIEHRISVMESWRPEAFREPFEDVHDRAYQQALDGLWSERALESYLRVIETPLEELQVLHGHLPSLPRDDFELGVMSVFAIEATAMAIDLDEMQDPPIIRAAEIHGFLTEGPLATADPIEEDVRPESCAPFAAKHASVTLDTSDPEME